MNSPHKTTETKTCNCCGECKPLSAYTTDRKAPDGLAHGCNKCRAGRARAWRRGIKCDGGSEYKLCTTCNKVKKSQCFNIDNPSRNKKGTKKSRCKECCRKESRKHYSENKSRYLSNTRDWKSRNAGKDSEYYHRRKSIYLGASGDHTAAEWNQILEACGGKCVRCGSSEEIHKDHIQPLALGGSNSKENLQPLCKTCNCSKGSKLLLNWIFETTGVEQDQAIH